MPNQTVVNMIIKIAGLVNTFHKREEINKETRIIIPPIVGVPCFKRCLSGRSSSIVSMADIFFSILIKIGPKNREINREVIKAPMERKVT